MVSSRVVQRIGVTVAVGIIAAALFGQVSAQERVDLPATATLEGVPTVRIESDETTTTRRELDPAEAAKDRLRVRVVNGQFYWTSRDNRPLRLDASGAFTYLSATDPGRYIRLTRVNDKITYVEHVDFASGSVTWWGELRIVAGR